MARVELEIPPRSAYVGVVRLAVAALARLAGLDEERVDDLKIAVGEACTNAVIAHEEIDVSNPIRVAWHEQGDRVFIDVDDSGGAPPTAGEAHGRSGAALDGDLVQEVAGDSESRRAMSMALLDQLVDELEMVAKPEGGTRARLVVKLPA